MDGPELLQYCGTNAANWAEKFCELQPRVEQGLMIAWFANAMCMSEEEQRSKDEKIAIEAIGLLSATLAARCGAWNGEAPKWFPEPPEWLDLWQKALQIVTADEKAPDYRELVESMR